MGIAHQGYFCTLFRGISRALATSKMELFVTLFNGFHPLTNVTKNPVLHVMGVLNPSLLLYIKILFQNIDTYFITNWVGNRRSPWNVLWIKKIPMTYLKRDPGVCGQKSLKNTGKEFILVKKNFFLRIFPAFNHNFWKKNFFYSLFGDTFQ